MSDEDVIDQIFAEKDYDKLKYASSKENIYQIATRLLDQRDVEDLELSRTLDFLGDQLRHEDIPNFKRFLTKALGHRNADWRTFSSVDKIIQKNFDQIDQPRAFLTHIVQNTNADIPIDTITTHFHPLMESQEFWNTLMESEQITDRDLTDVGKALVAHHNRTPNFRQKLNEVMNHNAVNDGRIALGIFQNLIEEYDSIPNAKELTELTVNNDKVRGSDLGLMGLILLSYYDESSDFEDALQSIMENERANEDTFGRLASSAITHHEQVQDFPELLQSIINHEKADDKAVQRATHSLLGSDMSPSQIRQTWSIITSNNQRTSVACSQATFGLSNAVLRNNPIPHLSRKLNLIYRECDQKMPQREANVRVSNFVGNLYPGNVSRQTRLFEFLIDQADTQGLLRISMDLARQKKREEESPIFGEEYLNTLTHFLTLTENKLRHKRGRN